MEKIKVMNESPAKEKWYFKKGSLIVSFLVAGPFMLPLVWFHPSMGKTAKIFWTTLIIAMTLFIVKSMGDLLIYTQQIYKQLQEF